MSNFNDKIAEFTGEGIPAYNRKLNEIIKKLNWLMGMRSVNGKPITESDQGPVFDLAPATSAGPNPWATDPAGNAAGWALELLFDQDYDDSGDFSYRWVWCGPAIDYSPVPWLDDPSGNPAGWIVCTQNTFWGTGQCPSGTTCQSYESSIETGNSGDNTTSPVSVSYGPSTIPITPPTSCTPRFYLNAGNYSSDLTKPYILLGGSPAEGVTSADLSWDLAISYDGTQIFHQSGTVTIAAPNYEAWAAIDPAGWLWNPGDLPGLETGNNCWILPYNGPASSNTNPQIVMTYTYTFNGLSSFTWWPVIFMTGA